MRVAGTASALGGAVRQTGSRVPRTRGCLSRAHRPMMVGSAKGSDLLMEAQATQERIFEVMVNYVVRADSVSRVEGWLRDTLPASSFVVPGICSTIYRCGRSGSLRTRTMRNTPGGRDRADLEVHAHRIRRCRLPRRG